MKTGTKNPRGPGETAGRSAKRPTMRTSVLYHRTSWSARGVDMIPKELEERWELVRNRAELLFLADNGGGCPDALAGPDMTPAARRVALRRMGFRVREEYDMPRDILQPDSPENREPWVRLTNGVAVNLACGFVSRTKGG